MPAPLTVGQTGIITERARMGAGIPPGTPMLHLYKRYCPRSEWVATAPRWVNPFGPVRRLACCPCRFASCCSCALSAVFCGGAGAAGDGTLGAENIAGIGLGLPENLVVHGTRRLL